MLKSVLIKQLALFLLLSQLATVMHAAEHQLPEDDHELCFICIHDTDSKNLLIDTKAINSFGFQNDEKIINSLFSYYLSNTSLYRARSPPVFLA